LNCFTGSECLRDSDIAPTGSVGDTQRTVSFGILEVQTSLMKHKDWLRSHVNPFNEELFVDVGARLAKRTWEFSE